MGKLNLWILAGAIQLGLAGIPAQSHAAERIRATIVDFSTDKLELRTRDGSSLKVDINDGTTINTLAARKMSDIKRGSFIGVTAVPNGPGGILMALEVHIFPKAQRGTGEGHYDWDLEPGSTMTNANVEATVLYHKGKELTLTYKGGSQKVIVPIGVPIVTLVPGNKSLLTRGAAVFVIAQQAADGSLVAQRMLVEKDGVRPPM